jgi:hypothetical protein
MSIVADNITQRAGTNFETKISDLVINGTPHWAKDFIDKLIGKRIIAGYPDGTFKPNSFVEIDAFIKMVVCSLGYNYENGKEYWAIAYIDKAKELKLIDGTEFNTYRRAITREEAAKVIVNALATKEQLPSEEQINKYITKVPDYAKIGVNYKKVALYAYATGLITGNESGAFNPKNNLSRAEAATIIMRLLDASLRKPIDIDEQLSNTLPELLKTDEEVWGRTDIRSLFSIGESDLKDGKIYFSNEPSFVNVLPKETLNPDINRQIHDLIKVLIDDNHFVRATYVRESKPDVEGNILPSIAHVMFAKDYNFALNGNSFFSYGFADKIPYKLNDDYKNKGLSNNASIQLTIDNLWWYFKEDGSRYNAPRDGWSNPYYVEKLKKSCMAVFGVETGNKVYKYVHSVYTDERIMLATQDTRFKTTTIDNMQVDFFNYGTRLNFYFTMK